MKHTKGTLVENHELDALCDGLVGMARVVQDSDDESSVEDLGSAEPVGEAMEVRPSIISAEHKNEEVSGLTSGTMRGTGSTGMPVTTICHSHGV